MDMIVCVRCHGYVELTIYKKNKEIHEGTLNCKNCEIVYPILYGIPIMWGDPIQYFSNRQKLGGELLSSVQSPQLKSLIKNALSKASKNTDLSLIEKRWTEIYLQNQKSKFYDHIIKSTDSNYNTVLEHGCSIGIISRSLSKKTSKVFGIDKSFYAIMEAKKLGLENAEFVVADSLDNPFGDVKFELILGLNLFEIIEPKQLIKLISTQIQKNGKLILSDPYDYDRGTRTVKEPLYEDTLRAELINYGFVISSNTKKSSRIPWELKLHDRSQLQYLVDLVIAHKT